MGLGCCGGTLEVFGYSWKVVIAVLDRDDFGTVAEGRAGLESPSAEKSL